MGQRNTRGVDRKRISTAEKRAMALDLRAKGHSLRSVARELKLSGPQQASNLIEGALKDIQSPAVAQYRKEIDERSRLLLQELMPVVLNSKKPFDERMAAMDRVVRIDRELRALHGLDAPTQSVQLTAEVAAKDVHQQLLDRLARLAESVGEGEADPKLEAGGGS